MDGVALDFTVRVLLQLDYRNLDKAEQLSGPWPVAARNDWAKRAQLDLFADDQEQKLYAVVEAFSSPGACAPFDNADLRYVTFGNFWSGECELPYSYPDCDNVSGFEVSRTTFEKLAKLPTRQLEKMKDSPSKLLMEDLSKASGSFALNSLVQQCRFPFGSIHLVDVRGFEAEIEVLLAQQTVIREINIIRSDLSPRSVDLITEKLVFHIGLPLAIVHGSPLSCDQTDKLVSKYLDWQKEFQEDMSAMQFTLTIDRVIADVAELQEHFEFMNRVVTHKSVAHRLWGRRKEKDSTGTEFKFDVRFDIKPHKTTTALFVIFFERLEWYMFWPE